MKTLIPLRAEWTSSFPLPKKVLFPKHLPLWTEAGTRQMLSLMGRILIALPALLGLLIIMQSFMTSDSPIHPVSKPVTFIGPANVLTGTMDGRMDGSATGHKATIRGVAPGAISVLVRPAGS